MTLEKSTYEVARNVILSGGLKEGELEVYLSGSNNTYRRITYLMKIIEAERVLNNRSY